MGLVDYSDSEESGSESSQISKQKTAPLASPKPSTFQRADRTDSGKIRVDLPEVKRDASKITINSQEPPTKRARTQGLFGGLDLPSASKKQKKLAKGLKPNALSAQQGDEIPLDKHVNLRTGAAPAFGRSLPQMPTEGMEDSVTVPAVPHLAAKEEVKLVGKTTMFKPLSVGQKPKKNMAKPHNLTPETSLQGAIATRADNTTVQRMSTRPKTSLFGSDLETPNATSLSNTETGVYKPFLETESPDKALADTEVPQESSDESSYTQQSLQPHVLSQTSDLEAIAKQLNLSAGERRQLFGRDGRPDASKIQQFNLAREYQLNNEMRQSQATAPQQNPVRSIAPGKHSLQQLLNAATSQKDALEDSFAQGRRNKSDAGNRYGW